MLFSEPKIPQSNFVNNRLAFGRRFSALQRAENSSLRAGRRWGKSHLRFSALQRAENSSRFHSAIRARAVGVSVLFSEPKIPHLGRGSSGDAAASCFSALQRAENSSRHCSRRSTRVWKRVSVLFSEPKIPHKPKRLTHPNGGSVSVLFSEPKIPQRASRALGVSARRCFSALQRAENSSQRAIARLRRYPRVFQCSSASRKFLTCTPSKVIQRISDAVSVLFSEPKIPQLSVRDWRVTVVPCFSALQRAENSSMQSGVRRDRRAAGFQCSSASRKFLN